MTDRLQYKADCLFCRIAAGEIPSTCVYQDEATFAFRDIHPQAPVHVLVIPRRHLDSIAEVDETNAASVARCLETVAKVARLEGLDDGFRVISNCGENAGQTVRHLHFHVLAGKEMGLFN